MRRHFTRLALALGCLTTLAPAALAHPGHAEGTFHDGFTHPMLGWDHLLAMVAVGLLGARLGGRALWLLPATFLSAMLAGGLAATAGLPLPLVETGIVASVLVLGLAVAVSRAPSLAWSAALVGGFALFHGHAHAAEMVSHGSLASYAGGFLFSTALLHLVGICGGLVLARAVDLKALRVAGGAISAASLLLVLGLL